MLDAFTEPEETNFFVTSSTIPPRLEGPLNEDPLGTMPIYEYIFIYKYIYSFFL